MYTGEQVRLLKGLVSRVVLVFDGDAAGVKAMWRAFPLFAEEGLAVRVLPLPAGMDPDTYAFRHGVDLFRDPWDQAQPWFAFVLEGLIGAHTLDIQGRVQIVERLRPFFQPIADPVEQGLWLKFTAERLAVEEASLRRSLTGATPLCVAKPGPENGLAINLEKKIIKWILHHPSAFSLQDLEEWTLDFEDSELQSILGLIIETYRQCGSLDHSLLIQQTGEERLQQQICTLTLSDLEVSSLSAELLADEYRRALLSRRLEKARQALKAKLAQAVVQGGEDYLDLLTQRQDLDRQLEALKAQVSGKGDGG
jgi:DNA primase